MWMPIGTCSFTCGVSHLANEMAVLFFKAKRSITCVVSTKYYYKTIFLKTPTGLVLPGYRLFRAFHGIRKKTKSKITAGPKNTLKSISYQIAFGKQINILEGYDLTLCISN